jgi:antitoxin (DNA-binding transcriptional repressor) of toxin-antitoxin stability system
MHITDAELARDTQGVLDNVQRGAEVIVERGHRPVARIAPVAGPGRPIDECIAAAKLYEERLGYAPTPDADFARDVQAGIDMHPEGLNPLEWE